MVEAQNGRSLYIPLFKKNMFSIGHLVDKGIITTQNINNCIIKTQMAKGRSS
jgi:hypothetical protein